MHHLLWDDDPHLINNYPENDFVCTKTQWKKSPKKKTGQSSILISSWKKIKLMIEPITIIFWATCYNS